MRFFQQTQLVLALTATTFLSACSGDTQTVAGNTANTFDASRNPVQIFDNWQPGTEPSNTQQPIFAVETIPPADCMVATNEAGIRFCYQRATRTLSAYGPDDSRWWAFALPGVDSSNKIEHLLTSDDELIIVANLNGSSTDSLTYELTKFDFGGGFLTTTQSQTLPFGSATVDADMQSILIRNAIYLIADCQLGVNNKRGTYMARIFTASGEPIHSECKPGLILSGMPTSDAQSNLVLTINGQPTTFDRLRLTQLGITDIQPYSLDRRVAIRDEMLAIISSSENSLTNAKGNISVAPSTFDNSFGQLAWAGSFTRSSFLSGISETVDVNLSGSKTNDSDGPTRMAGAITAIQTGADTQTFSMSVFNGEVPIVRYEIVADGMAVSVEEPW